MRKLESVRITRLFGYKDNDYYVKFINEGPITFIYAFNGVGKTTLLKLIYAVIKRNWEILRSIEFESIILNFTQNEQLIVKKEYDKDEQPKFTYKLTHPRDHHFIKKFSKKVEYSEINQFLDNLDTKILFANQDLFNALYSEQQSFEFDNPYIETDRIPVSLDEVQKSISEKKHAIEAIEGSKKEIVQSLTAGLSTGLIPGLVSGLKTGFIPGLLRASLGGILGGPVGLINSLTVGGVIGTSIGLYNINKKRKDASSYQEELEKRLNIDEKIIEIKLPDKIDYIQKCLGYYVSKDKSIDKKIALFEDIINTYNKLTDKTLHINRETGQFEIQTILSSSKLLDVKYLSSGEKNLLLLYFHIIFKSPDSISDDETFIELIDEPEVSMHPAWLMNFVDSLKHINEVLDRKDNYQYIITTHSPGITYANSKLMVELKREVKNGQ